MLTRLARREDRDALMEIWRVCFGDPEPFIQWFFTARFVPEYSAVTEVDGKVVSCAHALPQHIRLRGVLLPCAVVAGVATLPDYAGRSCMRKTFTHLMQTMRGYAVPLLPHRPAVLETFYKLGHFPVSDTQYIRSDGAPREACRDGCEALSIRENYGALYRCYAAYARRYSGMIARSYADFVLKCADYLSCGAQCLAVYAAGEVTGYCIYFDGDKELLGEECVAHSDAAYTALCTGLAARAGSRPFTLRLASDARVSVSGATASVEPRSVMGVSDIRPVLRAVGLTGGAVEVTDPVLPENAGVYDLSGVRTEKEPQLRLSAGRLLQWAVGYRAMADIAAAGEAEVFHADILQKMDSVGTCPCFIIDEY